MGSRARNLANSYGMGSPVILCYLITVPFNLTRHDDKTFDQSQYLSVLLFYFPHVSGKYVEKFSGNYVLVLPFHAILSKNRECSLV